MKNPRIQIRYQQVKDAKRFFEILNNPNFIYLNVHPESVEDERKFLKKNAERRKNGEHNFSIISNGNVIGAVGIKTNQTRKHIGEIGYFVDETYWGKGIASKAVQLTEKFAIQKLGMKRFEIFMQPANIASEKVAIKNGYKKEGRMRGVVWHKDKYTDCFLYAKFIDDKNPKSKT